MDEASRFVYGREGPAQGVLPGSNDEIPTIMHWLHTEYLLKGLFLGLLLDVALREASRDSFSWDAPARVGLSIFAGLVLALLVAAVQKLRAGYRVGGRLPAFILFLLLESPGLVYIGILGGLLFGSVWVREGASDPLFVQMALGGAALGVVFTALRVIKDKRQRLWLCLVMGAALVGIFIYWFGLVEGVEPRFDIKNATGFAVFLLMGLPVFYLLTFAGQQEETEVEVGALCGTLGIALLLLTRDSMQFRSVAFLLPVLLFFWYTMRVMPGLRVFKHVLRGMSHAAVGRYREALLAFRRALQLDARNPTAREEFWKVHLQLDTALLERDPKLLALVDFKLCIERAGSLLLENPTPERMVEAHRLLDLVASQKPVLQPAVNYWRAVARTHERKLDDAVELLAHLLDPEKHSPKDPARRSVLMQGWQLALTLHEELRRRVGQPQLALPGRRMEAIMGVERHMANEPDDQDVWPLKRLLYQDMTLEDFEQGYVEGKPPELFDYGYAQQLGSALIDDPVRWERGVIYLDIAARGMLPHAPTLYAQIAQAYEKAGRHQEMWRAYDLVRRAGLAAGHKNLAEQERQTFFRAVKLLGEEASTRGDVDAAIDHYHLYAEYERSGIETLRTLADLYERRGDALAALRITERALAYNKADKDLLERKDRYLVSVTPEVLKANLEAAGPELDIAYCTTKAKSLLDYQDVDLEVLDWAEHLVTLALIVKPDARPIRVMKARARWRRGEVEEAAAILEAVRTPKPEKFAGGDDEEAWFTACQLLGDLYLNNLARPQDAIACLNDYRKSPKSGARTYFRLAQAYEQLGDTGRAVKCYQQVAAYDGNPLQYEAQDALSRLGHS